MTNITIQEIRAYIALANTLSFTRAAEQLNLSQPALSYKLQQLEEKLGAVLFERSSRRVNMTEAGLKILSNAERLLQDLDHTLAHMQQLCQEDNYRIVITCSEGVAAAMLAPVMAGFQERFPHTSISILDDTDSRVIEHLTSGAAHLGITSYWQDHPDFLYVPVQTDQLYVLFPAGHPLETLTEINLQALAQYDFIGLTRESDPGQLVSKLCTRDGIDLQIKFTASHISTLMNMVQSNLGISVVPRMRLPLQLHESLRIEPLQAAGAEVSIGIVSQVKRPMAVQIQLLRQVLIAQAENFSLPGSP
ncbi:LysR family transcriptional regulator [Aliamphritea hakodatensis]|uniref:LysR family transcriptional regulator n=1 Tax=Aliamphritea hakodatensis TaxID=2895352 RepID=UPI0022FD3CAD|nr:LysR family transcriptional regulator [Aliamphritea hakodatensis]